MKNKYDGFDFGLPQTHQNEDFTFEARQIDNNIIKILRETKPWITFIAVLCLAGFLVSLVSNILDFFYRPRIDLVIPGEMVGYLTVIGLIVSLFTAIPAINLWRYSSAIKKAVASRDIDDFETALERQKGYWMAVGIITFLPLAGLFVAWAAFFIFAGAALV